MGKFYFLIGILFFELPRPQNKDNYDHQIISRNFHHHLDIAACNIMSAKRYIQASKVKKNYLHPQKGCSDDFFHSFSKKVKLKHSDSAVKATLFAKNGNLMVDVPILIVKLCHFSFRRSKNAVDEYIKAFNHTRSSTKAYLKDDPSYHISILKCNLGRHGANRDLQRTADLFIRDPQTKRYNKIKPQNRRACYPILQQMTIRLKHLFDLKPSNSLTGVDLDKENNGMELQREYGLHLSSTINRTYNNTRSAQQKEMSERPVDIALVICLILASASIIVIVIRKVRFEKRVKSDLRILEDKIIDHSYLAAEQNE